MDRTGLQYFNARYHDNDTGRFITPDPTVPNPTATQCYNRYMFVVGNPISFIDVSGYADEEGGISDIVSDICNAISDASDSIGEAISGGQTPSATSVKYSPNAGTQPNGSQTVDGSDEPLCRSNEEAKANEDEQKRQDAQKKEQQDKETVKDAITDAEKSVADYEHSVEGLLSESDTDNKELTQGLDDAAGAAKDLAGMKRDVENGDKKPGDAIREAAIIKDEFDERLDDLNNFYNY